MRLILPAALVAVALAGCSKSPKPTGPVAAAATPAASPVRITQFYTSTPFIARGESGLLCYGVENAKSVWLSPPRKEIIAAVTHCEEVTPTATTTYTLTAEGASGPAASRDVTVTVTVGLPHVKIIEVQFTTLDLRRGDVLGICYQVQNAEQVDIAPIGYKGGSGKHCTTDHPVRTTTYTVTAVGPGGDKDKEQATVKVH